MNVAIPLSIPSGILPRDGLAAGMGGEAFNSFGDSTHLHVAAMHLLRVYFQFLRGFYAGNDTRPPANGVVSIAFNSFGDSTRGTAQRNNQN